MNNIPDLSAVKLSIICSEIADGQSKEENFNQGLYIGIILDNYGIIIIIILLIMIIIVKYYIENYFY